MFVSTASVTKEINGRALRFYPISYRMATRLHTLASSFAGVIDAYTLGQGEEGAARRKAALKSLLEQVSVDRATLAQVVIDSLRDAYPQRPAPMQEADKLADEADMPTMLLLMAGVIEANKVGITPLVTGLVEKVLTSRDEIGGIVEWLLAAKSRLEVQPGSVESPTSGEGVKT